ncbi:MAG: FGGY family carbohydrate kinase [Pseudomonadota bacterium]
MIPSLILAIDQGGQSSRVAVYDCSGKQLCCFSAPCATNNYPLENSVQYIEQNGKEILEGIRDCLLKIKLILGVDIARIQAAGFAGQGSSLLCWDTLTGAALTPVLSWQDIRGEHYLKNIFIPHEELQVIAGLRLSPHYGASKIRWCLEKSPVVVQALKNNRLSVGPIVSYIFWHLLARKNVVDPGHAQRTLLWNLQKNTWDNSLLNLFKIPKAVLPECLFHDSHFGDLMLDEYKIPFTACARDQGASLFARGMPEHNAYYINLGTGAFIQRVSEQLTAPSGLLVSPLWLSKDAHEKKLFCWEATVNGAASAMTFMQQQTGLLLTPNEVQHALTLSPPHACYFLNAIGGLSAPYWRTDLQSQFGEPSSPHEKILAWLESVIFQIMENVNLMAALDKSLQQTKKIIISGGLSNVDAICQKIADLSHLPVHRSDNTDATLQGIACLAAGISMQWQPQQNSDIFMPQENRAIHSRFQYWKVKMSEWLQ